MRYYPVNLNIKNRSCLVVGGGRVGTRKVKTLLECGAQVTVISPEVSRELEELTRQKRIHWHRRDYRSSDLEHIFLVIGATDDQQQNQQIHQDAEKAKRLCNIVDQPDLCNFILPAFIRQGDLMIAISTAGKSPAFAKHLRRQLTEQFGPEYGRLLNLMGAIRQKLLAQDHAPEAHKPLFEQLIGGGLLEMITAEDEQAIDGLLNQILGPEFEFKELMETK